MYKTTTITNLTITCISDGDNCVTSEVLKDNAKQLGILLKEFINADDVIIEYHKQFLTEE